MLVRIELVNSYKKLQEIREPWRQLLSTREGQALPLTHEWMSAWWNNFGANRELSIYCIYDDNRLLAIAPFYKLSLKYRGIPTTGLRLMANGHSPFCDLIIDGSQDNGQVSKILDMLLEANSENLMVFAKLPVDSQVYLTLAGSGHTNGLSYGTRASLVTPVLRIDGAWDDYFRSRSRKFRKSIKHKLNRLAKEPNISIDQVSVTSAQAAILDEIVAVSKRSWKTRVNNDLGSNSAGRNFLFDLVDAFGPGGSVSIWIMRKAGVAIAFEFHLLFDDVVYPLRADFDENYRNFSPGSVLEYTALKNLFEEKTASTYYSCADNYRYLINWTNESRKHFDVEVFNRGLKPFMLHALEYRAIPVLRNIREKAGLRA
jgi:CelD/BcsL family acetyltransferase involved in cellulose biosynthesis